MTKRSQVLSGIAAGGVVSGLSWAGNLIRDEPGLVSMYPDLLTLVALPVLIVLLLRRLVQRGPVASRAALRRAGMTMVGTGAVVFAAAQVTLGVFRFSRPPPFLLLVVFTMALFSFVLVGLLGAGVGAAWLTRGGAQGDVGDASGAA